MRYPGESTKHKFNAKPVEIDNIKFQSTKEGNRYFELKLLKRSGDVIFFLRQVPFHLPGKVKYVCDFQVFWNDGTISFEDVKGFKTPMYKRNKKQVEELYPIKITEI